MYQIIATKLQTADQIETRRIFGSTQAAQMLLEAGFTVVIYRNGRRVFGPRTKRPEMNDV